MKYVQPVEKVSSVDDSPTRTRVSQTILENGPSTAADLAAFLRAIAPRPKPLVDEFKMALNVADPARGRLAFRSVGCLGCHTRGGPHRDEAGRAAPIPPRGARSRRRRAAPPLGEMTP